VLTARPIDLPAYTLLDVRVGWRDEHWDAALIATNLLDADYISHVDPGVNADGSSALRLRLGDPRHVEARLTWFF
jgi:outer membrane receptor protein involved in Fe transport